MQFERLLYGWSRWGIDKAVGFQPIAASSGFQLLQRKNSPVWRRAISLCYNPIPRSSTATLSRGWVPAGDGLLIFWRSLSGSDGYGRDGAYTVQILYSPTKPPFRDVISLLDGPEWIDVGSLNAGDTKIQPLRPIQASLNPTPPSAVADALLEAMLAGLETKRRSVIVASDDEIIDGLAQIAIDLPLPEFLTFPVSTLESKDTSSWFTVTGRIPSLKVSGQSSTAAHGIPEAFTGDSKLGRTVFMHPSHARASEQASRENGTFHSATFRSVLSLLVGEPQDLTYSDAGSVVSSASAMELASRDSEVTAFLTTLVVDDWATIGKQYCETLSCVNASCRSTNYKRLAEEILTRLEGGGPVPDVALTLRATDSRGASLVAALLMTRLGQNEELLYSLPPETTRLVLGGGDLRAITPGVAASAAHAPRVSRVALAQDPGINSSVRAAIAVRATTDRDCDLVRRGLHLRDAAFASAWIAGLAPDQLVDDMEFLVGCVSSGKYSARAFVSALEDHLADTPSDQVAYVIVEARLRFIGTGDIEEVVAMLGLQGLTPRAKRLVGKRLVEDLSSIVLSNCQSTHQRLLTVAHERLLNHAAALEVGIAAWNSIGTVPRGEHDSHSALVRFSDEYRLWLESDPSPTSRLAAFVRGFEQWSPLLDSSADIRTLIDMVVGSLTADDVWTLALMTSVRNVDQLQHQGNHAVASQLANNVENALNHAVRSGQFGRSRLGTNRTPDPVRTWHRKLKKITSEAP